MKCYLVEPITKQVKEVEIEHRSDVSKILSIDNIEYPITGTYMPHYHLEFLYVNRYEIEKTNKDAWKFLNKESIVRYRCYDYESDEWFPHVSCGKLLIAKFDSDDIYKPLDVNISYNVLQKIYKISFAE
jgi:hypothetical protein